MRIFGHVAIALLLEEDARESPSGGGARGGGRPEAPGGGSRLLESWRVESVLYHVVFYMWLQLGVGEGGGESSRAARGRGGGVQRRSGRPRKAGGANTRPPRHLPGILYCAVLYHDA